MRATLTALTLFCALTGANAATVTVDVTNVTSALLDLSADDGADPYLSVTPGELAAFATSFSTFDSSVPVHHFGGTLGAHSAAQVSFDFSLTMTLPNWEYANAFVWVDSFCAGSACLYPGWVGFIEALAPTAPTGIGTITRTMNSHGDLMLRNDTDAEESFDLSYTTLVRAEDGPAPSPVPEPSSFLLVGAGLMALGFRRWVKHPKD